MTTAIDWHGKSRQSCPACGPKGRTCGVTIDARGGVAHCHRCGYVETELGTTAGQIAPQRTIKHDTLSEHGRALWNACTAIQGDGAAYLKARNCAIPPNDGDLRYHPALKHPPSGLVGPALVGLVTDAVTREPLTLHRTWVQANGKKAPLDPPRMLLGGHRKQGGVIRLWSDDAVTLGLGIGEGIETTLSLAHVFKPVWACIDAGNLAQMPVLGGVETLVIAADNDPVGTDAAARCADRWADAGCEVFVVTAPGQRQDFNDLVVSP